VAIKAELTADRDAGAGHGRLRIIGVAPGPGPIDFALRRNQGTAPFLGLGGGWQATEAWHPATGAETDSTGTLVIPLGPAIIDPIVGQATNVTYQLTLAVGAARQLTSLKVIRPLFGSGAAAADGGGPVSPPPDEDERQRQDAEEARRQDEQRLAALRQAEDDERRRLAEEAARATAAAAGGDRPAGIRWPLVAAVLALVVAGAGAGAWFGCVIPGFGGDRCTANPAPAAGTQPAVAPALSCTGLDAAACYQVAERALQQRQLEPARQLLQQASSLGSIEASVAVGRMYDPDTWSAANSPVAQPSWETAVFWYEKAARQGDAAAQATAGRLLCKNAKSDFERGQGRAYLEQAASAGNDEAKRLLPTCM
jgi:TPR repeat protein